MFFLKILQIHIELELVCAWIFERILHLFYKNVTLTKKLPNYGISFNRLYSEKKAV